MACKSHILVYSYGESGIIVANIANLSTTRRDNQKHTQGEWNPLSMVPYMGY